MNKLKVIFYIDGFNLYYGLRDFGSREYLWLNLQKLAYILTNHNETLEKVKYFTTMVSDPPDKVKRQVSYIEALKTQDKIEIFEGTFITENKNCWKCQYPINKCSYCGASLKFHREKKTDVNIGCQTLLDCALDKCDVTKIISADSDLVPVAETIKKLYPDKVLNFVFPPNTFSSDLAKTNLCNKFFVLPRRTLSKCQFPDQIISNQGYTIQKPDTWI